MSVLGRWWWCIVGCNESLKFKNIVVCLFPPPFSSCRTVNLRWNSFRSQFVGVDAGFAIYPLWRNEGRSAFDWVFFVFPLHIVERLNWKSRATKIRRTMLACFNSFWWHRRSIVFLFASLVDPLLLPLQFLSSFRCIARKFSNLHHRSTLSRGFEWDLFFPGSLPLLSHPAKDRSRLRSASVYSLSFGQGLNTTE